ncbi:MAG: sugar phosphate isomerase/epimerase [Planctomycetaceae bacterium]|nr:sugar phosphate isomerase/epimerase [Planctomycetaceae bacterium]
MVSRRDFVKSCGVATLGMGAITWAQATVVPTLAAKTSLGLVAYSCRFQHEAQLRQTGGAGLFAPMRFLQHCVEVGAGGAQISLGILSREEIRTIQEFCQEFGLFLEGIVSPPRDFEDLNRFDREMQSAKDVGAMAVRTVVIPGRRYERFQSLEDFREAEKRARGMLERAAPIAERLRLPLAVENHKDQRNEERLRLFETISSEFVGACVDTGNSLALLEDPLETVRVFAPWAKSAHLKDQALLAVPDGFLLADIPLGKGCLNLREMVKTLKHHQPQLNLSLELITRDPLVVPCLQEGYWTTLPDVPAIDLARILRLAHLGPTDSGPRVSGISKEKQVELERQNVQESLVYARNDLEMSAP